MRLFEITIEIGRRSSRERTVENEFTRRDVEFYLGLVVCCMCVGL